MKKISRAKMQKLALKAARSLEVTVKNVLPPPPEDICYTIRDGYLMRFKRGTKNQVIFLEDLYQKVRGETVPKSATDLEKRSLSIKLKIEAGDISLRAMSQQGIHLDLSSPGLKVQLMAEFGPEAMIICEYTNVQPRSRHDYSKVAREYSWKVLDIRGMATPVHIATLYRRISKHDKLKFSLIS